jgi:flavin reductase (DIM6/NTAB) family NADH-FMN oxidoreductase RutF
MSDTDIAAVLKKIPYPVSVVTLGAGGAENGLTISWLSQVSFDPPMIMFAMDKNHYSNLPIGSKSFVVNLLKSNQNRIAGHFARQSMEGESKIEEFPTREAASGSPILTEALAFLDCELEKSIEIGDHILYIGKVIDAGILNEGQSLTSASGILYQKS